MKLKTFAICLLIFFSGLVFLTGCEFSEKSKEVEMIQEDGNAIYPLQNKYHIFRNGELETSLRKNEAGLLLTENGKEVDLTEEALWDLVFEEENTYKYTGQDPQIGWKWSFFPLKDLGTYQKDKVYYSKEDRSLIRKSIGIVTGSAEKEAKMNAASIYMVILSMFLIAGLYNEARVFPGRNPIRPDSKPWNLAYLYVGIFVYLLIIWICHLLTGSTGLIGIIIALIFILGCLGYKVGESGHDVFSSLSTLLLLFFLGMGMMLYFLPTGNHQFISQYLAFLAVLAFIAHFSTKSFLERRKRKKEEKAKEIQEAYEK